MSMDDKTISLLQERLAELHVALLRKRSEVSNLTVGYQRARAGLSPIPAEPLERNLVAKRAELTALEEQAAAVASQLPAAGNP